MADIDIERKRSSPWPWIVLGVVVLALLAWWLLTQRGDRTDDVVLPADTAAVPTTMEPGATGTGPIAEFVRYSDEGRGRGAASATHEYTAGGIRRLADALDDLGRQRATTDPQTTGRIPQLRRLADSLQAGPESPRHANHARAAFVIAADIITALRADAARGVRQAAEAVQPTTPLLNQREQVRAFFDRAADALRDVAGGST